MSRRGWLPVHLGNEIWSLRVINNPRKGACRGWRFGSFLRDCELRRGWDPPSSCSICSCSYTGRADRHWYTTWLVLTCLTWLTAIQAFLRTSGLAVWLSILSLSTESTRSLGMSHSECRDLENTAARLGSVLGVSGCESGCLVVAFGVGCWPGGLAGFDSSWGGEDADSSFGLKRETPREKREIVPRKSVRVGDNVYLVSRRLSSGLYSASISICFWSQKASFLSHSVIRQFPSHSVNFFWPVRTAGRPE